MSVKHGVDIQTAGFANDIAALDKKMSQCDSAYSRLYVEKEIITNRIELLTKNGSFGPQGLNDPNTQKSYDMYCREMESLKKAEYDIDYKLAIIKANRANFLKEAEQLRKQPIKEQPYVLVEVESKKAQQVKLSIDYRVSDVIWFPSYDMRAEQGVDELDLVMKAKIRQYSGEDWKNVKLRLSTASGNERADVPQLSGYRIDYGTRPPVDKLPELAKSVGATSRSTTGAMTGVILYRDHRSPVIGATVVVTGTSIATVSDVNGRFSINTGANSAELVFSYAGMRSVAQKCVSGQNVVILMEEDADLIEAVEVVAHGVRRESRSLSYSSGSYSSDEREYKEPEINLINTSEVQTATALELEIDGLSTVPSLQEPYSVDVRRYELPLNYVYVSAPRAAPAAYLQMRVLGMDKLTLLDGELNMFFDNSLVATSLLVQSKLKDTTAFGVNRDKRVQVRREAITGEPLHQIVGQKWLATRNWKYTVVNNTKEPIVVELSDRVPVSVNKDIVVTKTHDLEPITERRGVLTWSIELQPNQSKQFSLKYVVSCPKNRTVDVD